MAITKRPTAPHLQIYKWGPHMLLSITHRVMGVSLTGGALLLLWWLVALSLGPDEYALFQLCMGSALGKLVLFGFTAAQALHLCNGIRFLTWDMGRGFSPEAIMRGNILVITGTIVITALVWLIGYGLI